MMVKDSLSHSRYSNLTIWGAVTFWWSVSRWEPQISDRLIRAKRAVAAAAITTAFKNSDKKYQFDIFQFVQLCQEETKSASESGLAPADVMERCVFVCLCLLQCNSRPKAKQNPQQVLTHQHVDWVSQHTILLLQIEVGRKLCNKKR